MIRSAFVTYAKDNCSETVLKSIAGAMRHSVRYQTDVYDRRCSNDKLKSGVLFASNQARMALSQDSSSSLGVQQTPWTPTSRQRFEKGMDVALLARDSTPASPKVILGRVMKQDDVTGRVQLQEYVPLDNREDLYRLKIASRTPWCEDPDSILSGIDLVFIREDKAYELRTPLDDLLSEL